MGLAVLPSEAAVMLKQRMHMWKLRTMCRTMKKPPVHGSRGGAGSIGTHPFRNVHGQCQWALTNPASHSLGCPKWVEVLAGQAVLDLRVWPLGCS